MKRSRSLACATLLISMSVILGACAAPAPTQTAGATGSSAAGNNGTSTTGSGATTGAATTASASTQAAANTKGPDVPACSLVTRGEAEGFMGPFADEPKPIAIASNEIACFYGPNSSGTTATVKVYGSGQWALQRAANVNDVILPFAGLGEEAYYVYRDANTDLWTRKGLWVVNVTGSIGIITASELATAALSKL